MTMTQDTKCAFGLHKFEIIEEHDIKDYNGDSVLRVLVSRCTNCGKIHSDYIDMTRR